MTSFFVCLYHLKCVRVAELIFKWLYVLSSCGRQGSSLNISHNLSSSTMDDATVDGACDQQQLPKEDDDHSLNGQPVHNNNNNATKFNERE